MPSASRSNPCGSGGRTVNPLSGTSGQFKSGGGEAIQTSGYEGSQFPVCVCDLTKLTIFSYLLLVHLLSWSGRGAHQLDRQLCLP